MQTVQSPGVGEPENKRRAWAGVWGRCKHNLLPPKPACSLGERAPPSQPTWHPSCQGLGSLQARQTPPPTSSSPFLLLSLPSSG